MTTVPLRPTTLEIDLDAAANNLSAVRRRVGPERKLFAVIKADGYGFGAAEMGAVFAKNGADYLAVADLGEGIRLRQRGITAPILVYPNSLPTAAADTLAHGLVPTLVDLDAARAYSQAAAGPCEFFVKIDVGLERLGVPAEQAVKTILAMLELRHLRLGGICAHPHAEVGVDPAYADWQLGRFTGVVDELEARGVRVPVRLLAATPFVLRFPHTYLNAVDPGRMLYGITFPGETPPVPLRPTFRALATRVIALKELAPRERFAELAPFPVTAPMRLGVVPIAPVRRARMEGVGGGFGRRAEGGRPLGRDGGGGGRKGHPPRSGSRRERRGHGTRLRRRPLGRSRGARPREAPERRDSRHQV